MASRIVLTSLALAMGCAVPALAGSLVEPHLHVAPGGTTPQVALTLDGCMGEADMRVIGFLVAERIPATLFVTARWLAANPATVKLLVGHPELFQIENHGLAHVPAVIGAERPYGIAPAGTPAKVEREIAGGAEAVVAATGHRPGWYRDATALYSKDAIALIERLGFRVAGFSLNADLGATATAEATAKRIAAARDGDVIIAHMNQPRRAAGAGIVTGVKALMARGYRFVRLDDVPAL